MIFILKCVTFETLHKVFYRGAFYVVNKCQKL